MEKSFTFNVTVAFRTMLPLVPVMVRTKLPAGVVLEVVTLRVEVPELLSDDGLKLPVAPAGMPLTLKAMLPARPFVMAMVAVKLALPPEVTVRDCGEAESENPATFNVTLALCVSVPLVPVTVRVYVPAGVLVEVATV